MNTTTLIMVPFEGDDMEIAKEMAQRLGYGDNTAYTSTPALVGLFCLRMNAEGHEGCIVKTHELGFLFVQDVEDLNMHELHERLTANNA